MITYSYGNGNKRSDYRRFKNQRVLTQNQIYRYQHNHLFLAKNKKNQCKGNKRGGEAIATSLVSVRRVYFRADAWPEGIFKPSSTRLFLYSYP